MYEENEKPLPPGDATVVFADILARMSPHLPAELPKEITADNVVQWANTAAQPDFIRICRRLLLPGSRVDGVEHLAELERKARAGRACLLCLNHRSNLDVGTLLTLLTDQADPSVFHRIIWLAGRKLNEDEGLTGSLVSMFHRVVLTPKSWLRQDHTQDERQAAQQINMAALRAMHDLRRQGSIFALFPSGTRARADAESTLKAIEETDSYLKNFDYLLLCHINGCTLPVSRDRDMTHETPRLDRMVYAFGSVQRTDDWRAAAARRYPDLTARSAAARGIIDDIAALSGS